MEKDYDALQKRVCYPPDPNPRRPATPPPPLTCDTHVHLFGPPHLYPYQSRRVYTPPAAPLQHYLAMIGITGVERTVLVTPNAHGNDNSVVRDALIEVGDRFRGIAKINDDTTDDELARLHEAGFRGARFNCIDALGGGVDLDMFERSIERIAKLGWCIEFHVLPDGLMTYADWFRTIPIPTILDHFGRCEFRHGVEYEPFQRLVELVKDDHIWCKLCCADRQSATGYPWDDTQPFIDALIAAAPDRMLWGTDWPHGNNFVPNAIPNDGDLIDLMARLVPDETLRARIMAGNAARLFGWD